MMSLLSATTSGFAGCGRRVRTDAPSCRKAAETLPGGHGDGTRKVPLAVLDTQVVLDWLVFDDPAVVPLVRALLGGELRWIATAPMHAELMHVLGRGVGAAWRPPDAMAVSRRFMRCSEACAPAPPAGPALRCRDADDQMFIDLAVATRARWLVSRDRAVLALARRAREHGVTVLHPTDWAALPEWRIR